MGYFTYRAEKAAAKGAGSAFGWLIRIMSVVFALTWPLGIGSHHGSPSALGWALEVVWLLVLSGAAIMIVTSKRKGNRS